MDAGGWAEMKEARRLFDAGAVSAGQLGGRQIRALVRDGGRSYKSILVVGGVLGASAVCGCPTARRGLICRHALAVGLAHVRGRLQGGDQATTALEPSRPQPTSAPTPSPTQARAAAKAPAQKRPPDSPLPGPLTIELAPDWIDRLAPPVAGAGRSRPAVLPLRIGADRDRDHPGAADQRVWRWLHEAGAIDPSSGDGCPPRLPITLQVPVAEAAGLLAALADHPHVSQPAAGRNSGAKGSAEGDRLIWRLGAQPAPRPLHRRLADRPQAAGPGTPADEVEISWALGPCSAAKPVLQAGGQRWWQLPGHKLVPLTPWPAIIEALAPDLVSTLDQTSGPWRGPLRRLAQWLPLLDGAVEWIDDDPESIWAGFRVRPASPVMVAGIEGSLRSVDVQLHAAYADGAIRRQPGRDERADADEFPYPDPQRPGLWWLRQPAAELDAIARLERAGFEPFARQNSHGWRLSGEEQVLAWVLDELPAWQRDWQVQLGERWRHQVRQLAVIRPHLQPLPDSTRGRRGGGDPPPDAPTAGSGVHWFGFSLSYQAEHAGPGSTAPAGPELSRQDVLRLLRSGRRTARLPNGRRLVLDRQLIEQTEAALTDAGVSLGADGQGRVDAAQADYLDAVTGAGWSGQHGAWATSRERADLAPGLHADTVKALRDYQWHGLSWLDRLARSGRGGILADEMGLGKTVQTLAWLSLIHRPESGLAGDRPSMVVCPTSLLGNWRDEALRWAPELRVMVHHGSDRGDLASALDPASGPAAQLVITSYGILARDSDALSQLEFAAVILDEASAIKNPDTRNAVAARRLRAATRLALSGTPVENSVRDLWSILSFAMPGYLGSRKDFQQRFEKPLGSSAGPADPAVMQRLRLRLAPYLLRRRKRDVAAELPQRIEQVRRVDPTPQQAELYRRILTAGQEEIADVTRRSGRDAARMTMFTTLLRLRQVCNDPLLLPGSRSRQGTDDDRSDVSWRGAFRRSGKWQAFRDWLDEVREEGGKALVFSQFTSMLKLLRDQLRADDIAHAYLDGSTTDRDQQVRRFQTEPDIPLFLISLKAGGYGLNLTAANHVLLVDPWWNPAVEAQAIDRAHRIGQQQVVVATRLVTRGTVEDKILELQNKKRAVFDAALDEDQPLMQGLSDDDLRDLLA